MINIPQINLLDLIPNSISNDEQVVAAAQALDNEFKMVTEAINETIILANIDILPEQVIDLLAWEYHVDFYEPLSLTLETKRELVKNSIIWHMQKGTPVAVERVLSTIYKDAKVEEWFEYGGTPYHFKINVNSSLEDEINGKNVRSAVNTVKNTRSWLENISLYFRDGIKTSTSGIFKGITVRLLSENQYLKPFLIDDSIYLNGNIFLNGKQSLSGVLMERPPTLWITTRSKMAIYEKLNNFRVFLNGSIINNESIENKIISRFKIENKFIENVNIDGAYFLDGVYLLNGARKIGLTKNTSRMKLLNYEKVDNLNLTINHDLWLINGTNTLNGAKILDSEISKEAI